MCALTVDCRLLISVWNQHGPRPFPCVSFILTHRICIRYGVQNRCMIGKHWFRKLEDALLCTTVRRKNRVIRVWKSGCGEKCARAKMEMLGIMREAKNMAFQPRQGVRPGRGMLHDCSRAASLFLDAHPAALQLTPDNQQPSTTHHRRQTHTYSLNLLIMGT